MARLASTSLVFMLWLTPAPAWNGSTRKLSISVACSWRPADVLRVRPQAEELVGGLDDRVGHLLRQAAGLRGWRALRPS